jgi:hypothetical protein
MADEQAFADGIELGMWLESAARPALKRWTRSADKRVYLLAGVLSTLIEDRYTARDWPFLDRLRATWQKLAAEVDEDDGEATASELPDRRGGSGPLRAGHPPACPGAGGPAADRRAR